jgi:Tyrosine-protein kinase ephrin type A/B receptor-like
MPAHSGLAGEYPAYLPECLPCEMGGVQPLLATSFEAYCDTCTGEGKTTATEGSTDCTGEDAPQQHCVHTYLYSCALVPRTKTSTLFARRPLFYFRTLHNNVITTPALCTQINERPLCALTAVCQTGYRYSRGAQGEVTCMKCNLDSYSPGGTFASCTKCPAGLIASGGQECDGT